MSAWPGAVALAAAAPADGGTAAALLLEAFHFAVVLALVGLATFAVVRRASPLRRWGSHGNVDTVRADPADLLVAGCFIAFYYLIVRAAAGAGPGALTPVGDEAESGSQALQVAVGTLLMQVLFTGLVAFYLGVVRGWDLGEALGLRRMRASQILLWATAGTLLLALPLVVGTSLLTMRWFDDVGLRFDLQEPVRLLSGDIGWPAKTLLAVSAVAGAPVMEELLFRGFLYPVFKRFSDRFFAAIITALFFALAHNSFAALLPLVALGLLFALAYELSGTLLVPAAMHALFNASQLSQILQAGTPQG